MREKLTEFAKDSVYYALGDWLNKLGTLILVPILSRIFTPSDYGLIDLLNISYSFLLLAASLNMDAGLQKFYYLVEEYERKSLVSSTMLLRFLFASIVGLIIILTAKPISIVFSGNSTYVSIYILLALSIPLDDMYEQMMQLLRLDKRVISFLIYNFMKVTIFPLITYICVVLYKNGVVGVFIARFATTVLLTLPLLVQQRKYFTTKLNIDMTVNVLKFSLPALIGSVQLNIIDLLPRYMLLHYSTLSAVGLFGIADKIAKVVDMLKVSFNRAWNPFAFANAGKGDEKALYEKVFKFFGGSLLILACILTLFAKDILVVLTPQKYHSAAILVGGLSFYYALRALTLIYGTGLYTVNKVMHTSVLTTIQLATLIACSFILVPIFGATGIILSLDAAVIVYFSCYAWTVKKYFEFKFSAWRLAVIFAMAITLCAYGPYITPPDMNSAIPVHVLSKMIMVLIYICASYHILLSKNERTGLGVALKSLISKQ